MWKPRRRGHKYRNKPAEVERRREKIRKYGDHNLLERYKAWYFSRPTLPTSAHVVFLTRECQQLGVLPKPIPPEPLEVCLFLQQELERVDHKFREELEASVAELSMGNTKHDVRSRMLKERHQHLKNFPLFDWESEFTLLEDKISKEGEASVKKELGAEKQKDKGWEGEQEDHLECTPLEDIAKLESSVKEVERRWEKIKEYGDHNLLERYKAWYFSRPTLPTGAHFVFLTRECQQLGVLPKPSPPEPLEVCLFLQQELQRAEHKFQEESEPSVAELSMGNTKHDVQHRILKEGHQHLKNFPLFDWESEFTLLEDKISKEGEASMKKELGAEKQKDEGWEEEKEDKKSASRMAASSSTMEEFAKLFSEVKEEPMTFPSTMVDEDKRWSLEEEVNKLIDESLQLSFPGLGEESMTIICKEEYNADYQCENVLSIWPKLANKGKGLKGLKGLKGPESVGRKIKVELENRTDMIEGTPDICNIGFVTFKLSGKWMAKSLYKMLRYGIDTWAPKLPLERVIVEIPDYETPAWNSIVGTEADIIRSNFISDTLSRMLEYSKVFVKSSKDEFRRDVISRLSDDICSCLSIEKRDEDVVISAEVEGELESLNFGKRDIQDIRDSLKILWYELKDEKADWIVCLNPVRHQEFVEMCFAAAKHAGWIPTAKHHGLSFAGYRTHAEAGKLYYLLEKALTRCSSLVKQGKAAEYTAEQVFCCALGYEYLKNPRMAECSFTVDEMFNEKGNTFLYLLNTKSQVLSVLANSGKDIKLKNVSEFILENVEVLEKDKGRALAFHLLLFSQILELSCLSVLPHILCRYLHDLSQKFTSYNSSCSCVPEVGSVAETSRLILCEATATVMDKCFNLLGITPVSTFGELGNEPLKLLLDLKRRMGPKDQFISRCDSVIPSLVRYPVKTSRLEIIAISPTITKDLNLKSGKLFGSIEVHDKHGFLSDGWLPTWEPNRGMVSLFLSEWYDPVKIYNHGLVSTGNPNARHSVPYTTSVIYIRAELIVTSEREDAFFHLKRTKGFKGPDFRVKKGDGCTAVVSLDGKDMSALLYCIILKDAVDATVEVNFMPNAARLKGVKGKIYAYYGQDFPYDEDSVGKGSYKSTLLEPGTDLPITAGPVPLRRSMLAVPKDGSLVIEVEFVEGKNKKVILKGRHEFLSEIKGYSTYRFESKRCSLDLKVNWKYDV